MTRNVRDILESHVDSGALHRRVRTGKKFPADIHARQYDLYVQSVSDDTVTFEVGSRDYDPVERRYMNFIRHGPVSVPYNTSIETVLDVAVREADKAFFAQYTAAPFHEAFQFERLHGLELSTDDD